MKAMKAFFFLLLLAVALVARAETPNEGAAAILALIKSERYAELFRNRYTEWYKVEAEKADPEAAIARLSERWKKQREPLLSLYTQLTAAQFTLGQSNPQVSETGETATAKVNVGGRAADYRLYRMKNGAWGFHL